MQNNEGALVMAWRLLNLVATKKIFQGTFRCKYYSMLAH